MILSGLLDLHAMFVRPCQEDRPGCRRAIAKCPEPGEDVGENHRVEMTDVWL